ncbi:toll/interleukin-1 receptor domain-containing protein [Glutamicibacter ardleyensis]|uniref:toll/interleukin-1 receptor domain-containing protein n=1 Tax=Glutamicibacter ardleyensis TaxID=225894 RepID=UPI003FD6B62A
MSDSNSGSSGPRTFISYASEPGHDEWVVRLATRLEKNGVEVVFDQWDVSLGHDLAKFMEQGLTGSERVICICSDAYVVKANEGMRGVGYEKKIIAAPMLTDSGDTNVIPVLRNVSTEPPVPTFLSATRYVDFRDDELFEEKYKELVYDLYGKMIKPRPARGPNPFEAQSEVLTELAIRFDKTAFESTALEGTASFRYQDNDGVFTFGTAPDLFELHVSTSGPGSVHVYKDSSNIAAIGLAQNTAIENLSSPQSYDGSSRVRTARVGDTVVLTNNDGRCAAVQVLQVSTRDSAADGIPLMTFRFVVLAPAI